MLSGTRRCAVLGSPIRHSLSPVLHRAAYDELGLDWSYGIVELETEGLSTFLDSLDASWRGLSLTMPLKRAVVPLLDELTDRARVAAAANTVVLGGGRRLGDNTDVPGAAAALTERWDGPVDRAVVLGGGATAASVLLALADLGCRSATLLVRDPARADETVTAVRRHERPPSLVVERLADARPADVEVLVSTIPAAAQGEGELRLAEAAGVVFEVLYDPWPTPLAAAAEAAGQPLVGGLDLLVHQAVVQVELMTGVATAPLTAMRAAGEAALAARWGERPSGGGALV
ncbi:MAG TPA: shikimate dehydrogenase [Marmoricola sp.]|nr:shikimate dehydrogenase [Marmoricola sp.]